MNPNLNDDSMVLAPNVYLQRFLDALEVGDKNLARDAYVDLCEWFRSGGFAQDWSKAEAALLFYAFDYDTGAATRTEPTSLCSMCRTYHGREIEHPCE